MKIKKILALAVGLYAFVGLVLALAMLLPSSSLFAAKPADKPGGGGPNGTFVRFAGLDSYWKETGSGLIHEWRTTDNRHLVFKPYDKFESADCDEGYLHSFLWTAHIGYDQSYPFDEANLEDFLEVGEKYWVCIYEWDSEKPLDYPELVDTLTVYANDSDGVESNISLETGEEYIFRAMGTAWACQTASCNIEFDAEYSTSDGSNWVNGVAPPYGGYGPNLLDLKVGGNYVDWGEYNPSHEYMLGWTGDGSTVSFQVYDIYYPNNTGSLTVEIYAVP